MDLNLLFRWLLHPFVKSFWVVLRVSMMPTTKSSYRTELTRLLPLETVPSPSERAYTQVKRTGDEWQSNLHQVLPLYNAFLQQIFDKWVSLWQVFRSSISTSDFPPGAFGELFQAAGMTVSVSFTVWAPTLNKLKTWLYYKCLQVMVDWLHEWISFKLRELGSE